jgi:hypothetical protein
MASTAPIQWAQRAETIYFTIVLPDVKDAKVDLQDDKLTFRCASSPLRRLPPRCDASVRAPLAAFWVAQGPCFPRI